MCRRAGDKNMDRRNKNKGGTRKRSKRRCKGETRKYEDKELGRNQLKKEPRNEETK
jgi:hypothetical protein